LKFNIEDNLFSVLINEVEINKICIWRSTLLGYNFMSSWV